MRKGVAIEIRIFPDSTHTAADAAATVGAELGQIVKSLVFVAPTERGLEPVVALVSGSNRVDIARLAAVTGLIGLRRANADEASQATGFTIGGIPPFGHATPLATYMDCDLLQYDVIWAAAGTPKAVFCTEPAKLREATQAIVIDVK